MTPIQDWTPISPHLVVTGFAILVLLARARRGRDSGPDALSAWLATIGCLAGIACLAAIPSTSGSGLVWSDDYARFFSAVVLAAACAVCLASVERGFSGEFHSLLLLSAVGMMFMVSASSLLMLFLGLEVATICLFVLAGFRRADRKSCEAAVKFLTVGATASALFIFGASWLYGAAGSTDFSALRALFSGELPAYAWLGFVFVIAGFGFKISAAPFHLWAPDVYEGSPSMVVAFLSTASKTAALVALVRVLLVAFGVAASGWLPIISVLAVLTIVLGNLVAVVQTNVKRLLAYSGVAQAGFLLIAVAATAAPEARSTAGMALALYLLLYVFANAGAFLCVHAVSEMSGAHQLSSYDGLSRRNAPLAFALLIFLLSLAGVPPLAGFVGKWYLFTAGVQGGLWWLVLLGAVASTVSLYYYLIIAKRMYIHDPAEGASPLDVPRPLALSIAVCVAFTAIIGLYPAPWIELAQAIGRSL
ncbi:MAG: hypothetical protein AMXMBFR61_09880 [Fimbriimonadales bacterium]